MNGFVNGLIAMKTNRTMKAEEQDIDCPLCEGRGKVLKFASQSLFVQANEAKKLLTLLNSISDDLD